MPATTTTAATASRPNQPKTRVKSGCPVWTGPSPPQLPALIAGWSSAGSGSPRYGGGGRPRSPPPTPPRRPRGGHRLRDFTIINDLGTGPNVDGIAAHGEVDGGMFELLAITKVTGHGLAWTQLSGTDGDGVWIDRCMIQRPGLNGLHRIPNDANV